MNSVFASGASEDSQWITVGRRYPQCSFSTRRGPKRPVACSTPALSRLASMLDQIASAAPGTVNAARLASRILGWFRLDWADSLCERLSDLARVTRRPYARTIDAPSPAVGEDAVRHDVEILLPVIDDVIAEQDLAESRPVDLHARIAFVALDCRCAAEDQAAACPSTTSAPMSPTAWIDRNRLARHTRFEERGRHTVGRPRLLRSGLQHQPDLHRNHRQPQCVHPRRV